MKAHRLVTLTGVGGVGKTRLALEVAARLADEFPDGVWFFELAAVTDPAAVPDAVAAVLGITQQPGKSVSEQVAAALEGRVRLLVFDNCEHVLDAAADLVEAILAHSATAKILATSREGLGVADEQLWPVPSLDVGAGIDSAAVTLFVERAQALRRTSRWPPDEADAVVEICRRLDGIPLAIELAASRMASMTASDVRDRLDQRFRLLVGSRRGLARHQTLRHAVAWSYDLLDDAEKALLDRCSVFAGGFDLQSACAVAGFDDSTTMPSSICWMRWCASRCWSPIGRRGGPGFRCWRRSASSPRNNSSSAARQTEVRAAHSRYFAGREADILALWDSPRQREAYDWFTTELANLRTAFRWAADHGDLDVAATIATYAAWLGVWVENYEPIAWAEELIEPARAVDHPRLAFLYVIASQCYMAGRIEAAVGYIDAGQTVIAVGAATRCRTASTACLCSVYVVHRPARAVGRVVPRPARTRPGHTCTHRASLVCALVLAGRGEEAMDAANGLIEAAEATDNPWSLSFALHAYGVAFRRCGSRPRAETPCAGVWRSPKTAVTAPRRSHLAAVLSRLEAEHGDPLAAFDHFSCGDPQLPRRGQHRQRSASRWPSSPLFSTGSDATNRRPPSPGSRSAPSPRRSFPEITTAIAHLRDVLGEATYESLARKGETMTTAAMATYAYDQIDQARTELEHPS